MVVRRWSSSGGFVNAVTGSGTPCPEASTGMSSYFSKLMPVWALVGSLATPKSSRSNRAFAGPGTCLPSLHAPSPEPRGGATTPGAAACLLERRMHHDRSRVVAVVSRPSCFRGGVKDWALAQLSARGTLVTAVYCVSLVVAHGA